MSYERGFVFREGIFAGAKKYGGGYTFNRHFTGPDNVPAFDGKPGGDEEVCARELDALPAETLRYWIRNVAKDHDAFWLPLAGGRFYPDFVAELTDGKLMVIEYKGDHILSTDDTKEKVAVGQLWERAMCGKGLFVLVEKRRDGMGPTAQMLGRTSRG